ncbi:uncharacterized protein PHACADRAFT_265411 [Phanerochaete carnosa HHB-10118-sp]|uniref:Uncharacterized protein n=1 Tax=Phanerochaete carnosa (strain HHB-10118-sp) TaxID=650164 RepID=K5VF26_PHACS|nr:uncharacterized protein PHACADRAFT_265411 [Phanerochaete carnosa HHB-10118-sp]EKM49758.1 hypothetical protein PHACADRAFT_265411 [Phanerochaete carnosa HHB-10118-sp]
MNQHTYISFTPRAPQPTYPYRQTSSFNLMLVSQSTSTYPPATPPLVARSLASTPSSSTLPEVEGVRGLPADEAEILYATGLDSLGLDADEPNRWAASLQDEVVGKAAPVYAQKDPHKPDEKAAPYIPTIVRRRAAADPVHCGIEVNTWQPHREWLRPFRAGSVTSYSGVRAGYARDIVGAGPWSNAVLSELAARFVERVAEGCSETLACVAPLASEVHRCFLQYIGQSTATAFLQYLKQHLLSEYRAWWLSSLPSAIVNLFVCSPSPPHAPPFRNVSSAIAVATFIGDLFCEGLLTGSFVQLCMNLVLDKLLCLEEVEALHAVIHHSGERLYDRVPLDDFLVNLQVRCSGAPLTSAVGKMGIYQDVQYHVQAISSLIEGWARARSTPTPSEFSESTTEYSDYNPEHTVHRSHNPPPANQPAEAMAAARR